MAKLPRVNDIIVVKFISECPQGSDNQCSETWYEGIIDSIVKSTKKSIKVRVHFVDKEKRIMDLSDDNYGLEWLFEDDVPKDLQYITSCNKKQKLAQNEIVDDLKKEVEELKMAHQQLHLQVDELKNKVLVIESQNHRFSKCLGVMTYKQEEEFRSLPEFEKAKYLPSSTGLVGVMYKKEGKPRGIIMCSNYKNIEYQCQSKRYDSLAKAYISDEATYMSLSILGEPEIRGLHSEIAKKRFRDFAVCSSCKSGFVNNDAMNIIKRFEVCAICKSSRAATSSSQPKANKEASTFTRCGACSSAMPSSDGRVREKDVNALLSILKHMFPKYNISVKDNHNVVTTSSRTGEKQNRQIDMIVTGRFGEIEFYIVVEIDPDQHSSNTIKNETDKMLSQSINMLKTASKNSIRKLLMIRMNPNSKYIENEGQKEPAQKYDYSERMIILRQYIIWFLVNIEDVRSCIMMYLWYDKCMTEKYLMANDDCFIMLYHAPKCPESQNWLYCVDPVEIEGDAYKNILSGACKDIDDVFPKWKKIHEKKPFPIVILNKLKQT